VDATFPTDHIDEALLAQAVAKFQGKITQFPPIFSAIKQDGKRLYKIAREGGTVDIKSREVEILSFAIQNVQLPTIDFVVDCSKGTYIRSLAYDFGKALKSGAYLAELTRTKVGDYSLDQAWELDDFIESLPEKE
ncbi:MAG TPA: tRNA pseudouridine(55) synthase, partial [Saprospiraceae bacterium]|nr:tRNA pseudouridine(55) synthase [Saprospiraceae bacterium]